MRFILPDIGEGLDEAEIVEWLVAPGDVVERDQPLVEVLTDKSQTQLPSPVAGTVVGLGGAEGDRLRVGELVAELDDGPGAVDDEPAAAAAPAAADPVMPAPPSTAPGTGPSGRPKASPAVRRLARERGVDLASVTGSGEGGRILRRDVEAAAVGGVSPVGATTVPEVPAATAAAPVTTVRPAPATIGAGTHPLRGIRRATAESMARSWSEIPHIHGMDEIDATALQDARARIEAATERTTLLPLLALAVARTLARHPMLNASIDVDGGTYTVHDRVHLGIAVATADGLLVPVVRDAHARSLRDLGAELTRLITAARSRTIDVGDLRGGTATLTNFGSQGGRLATPIIRPPESAIVGFGAVRERPIVIDGEVVARPTLPVSIGVDHRLVDGDAMTAFQEELLGVLRDPILLLVDG
ncbi:MAG: dihydrolipoamide acetyltransferase family protein [Actinomycetota bacterium]